VSTRSNSKNEGEKVKLDVMEAKENEWKKEENKEKIIEEVEDKDLK
jgi:hypothetical protein